MSSPSERRVTRRDKLKDEGRCTSCTQLLDKDRTGAKCLSCHKKATKNRYVYRRKLRDKAVAHLGGKCEDCGTQDSLEFHHIQPKMAEINTLIRSVGWTTLLEEVQRCILLCHDCHKQRHAQPNIQSYQGGDTPF